MKKTLVCIMALLILLHYTTSFVFAQPPETTSPSIVLASADSDQILYELNGDETFSPAGLAKIMVAIVALDKLDPNELLQVTDDIANAASSGEPNVSIQAGENMTVGNLVDAMLIGNANDAAIVLGLYISDGNMSDFIAMMNQKAKDLGCVETRFANVTGNYDPAQKTTANEMIKILRAAVKNSYLYDVLAAKDVVMEATNLSEARTFKSSNQLRYPDSDYYYANVTGGKTGYLSQTGYNIAVVADNAEQKLLCVTLAASSQSDSFNDTRSILKYGFEVFVMNEIVEKDKPYQTVNVFGSPVKTVQLYAQESCSYLMDPDTRDEFNATINVPSEGIEAPKKKGEVIGTMTVTYQGEKIGEVNLVLNEDVPIETSLGIMNTVFMGVAVLLMLYVFYRLYKYFG